MFDKINLSQSLTERLKALSELTDDVMSVHVARNKAQAEITAMETKISSLRANVRSCMLKTGEQYSLLTLTESIREYNYYVETYEAMKARFDIDFAGLQDVKIEKIT